MSRASKRAWYLAHCLDCWRRAKAWRIANPERHRENQRRWREAHPGYAKAWRTKTKALRRVPRDVVVDFLNRRKR